MDDFTDLLFIAPFKYSPDNAGFIFLPINCFNIRIPKYDRTEYLKVRMYKVGLLFLFMFDIIISLQNTEKTLIQILKEKKVDYQEGVGEAKFYGPSIDLKAEDALGRLWQGTTIQFDFNLASRFNLKYTGQDGKEHTPYIIHHTLLGSIERFIGVLIEEYAGAFPAWLAPVQTIIIPITNQHKGECGINL